MNTNTILPAVLVGLVVAGLACLHQLGAPSYVSTPATLGGCGFVVTITVTLYFGASDARAIRNVAYGFYLIVFAIVTKVSVGWSFRAYLSSNGNVVPPTDGSVHSRPESEFGGPLGGGILAFAEAVSTSGWVVDCFLVLAAIVFAICATRLLSSLRPGSSMASSTTTPTVAWFQLQTTKGCLEYLIQNVQGVDPGETLLMQEVLRECIINRQGEWEPVVNSHSLGRRQATLLIIRAMSILTEECRGLHDLHGNILRSVVEVEERISKIQTHLREIRAKL